ncbi:MAG: hypothetical protein Q9178_007101 [Gyalolechia marmorata]
MPQPQRAVSHRPQTCRQARRAYQRAGATPRITPAEQRRIDRAAELQERAARIRLHNVRARENKRKKAEKEEKDREIRKRMGIQEPAKFKIGPSQTNLGSFVDAAPKHKQPESLESDVVECSSPYRPTEDTKTEDISMDCHSFPKLAENRDCIKTDATVVPAKPPERCCTSQQTVGPHVFPTSQKVQSTTMVPSTTLMPPPPPRLSSKTSASKLILNTCPQLSEPVAAAAAINSDWDFFLDSNTQVEREISGGPKDAPIHAVYEQATSATTVLRSVTPPADLLAGISTQDLQYSSSPLPSKSDPDKDAEFLGGIEDEDLSDVNVAAFFECYDEVRTLPLPPPPSSQHKNSAIAPHKEHLPTITQGAKCTSFATVAKDKDAGAFNRMEEFDDCGFSSQELRQLVA